MKDCVGWSDVMRASFGSVPLMDRAGEFPSLGTQNLRIILIPSDFGMEVVRSTYQKIVDESELDELRHLFSIQAAVFELVSAPI